MYPVTDGTRDVTVPPAVGTETMPSMKSAT
jgi:hypothetical protein